MANENSKGPKLAVVAMITTLLIGGAAVGGSFYWANQNAYAAKVNGETISTTEFNSFLERAKKQYAGQIGMDFNSEAGSNMLKNLKEQIMNSLVDMAVMKQAAKDMGISVTPEEKDTRFKEFLKTRYQGNEEAFEKALKDNRITRAEFDTQFADQVLLQELYQKVIADAKVSEKDVKDFFEKNQERFSVPEQIEAKHILIKADPSKPEEVKKAQQKAEDLLKQAKGGADFDKLAKTHSEDEGSKASGGDLGAFSKGRMVPEFEEAAFKLKPGEITPSLVKTQFGFHIIKRGKTIPAQKRTLAEVKTTIESQLQQQKQQEVFEKWLKETKDKAEININQALLEVPPPAAAPSASAESAAPADATGANPPASEAPATASVAPEASPETASGH